MSNITVDQIQRARGHYLGYAVLRASAPGRVTAQEWADMKTECVPVPEVLWDCLGFN